MDSRALGNHGRLYTGDQSDATQTCIAGRGRRADEVSGPQPSLPREGEGVSGARAEAGERGGKRQQQGVDIEGL